MPREGRIRKDYGAYHIIQKSAKGRKLFESAEDREKFLEIIERSKGKNAFLVHSICLGSDESYEMIIDTNGCNISNIMKEINIAYSIYKGASGCLFTDRFRSTLFDDSDLAGLNMAVDEMRSRKTCRPLFLDETRTFYEKQKSSCECRICSVEEGMKKTEEELSKDGLSIRDLKKDRDRRDRMIRKMRCCSTLSLKEIGQVFGLGESSISKIINNMDER